MSKRALLGAIVALTACGSSSPSKMDAAKPLDGTSGADAKVFLDGARPDAPSMSTVHVVANCTGVAAGDIAATITTSGFSFSPSTATIAAGQYIKFTTAGNHNFQNQPGAPADAMFDSGPPGAQTACLQFTVAGSYPFECVVHASMGMTGTLTVN